MSVRLTIRSSLTTTRVVSRGCQGRYCTPHRLCSLSSFASTPWIQQLHHHQPIHRNRNPFSTAATNESPNSDLYGKEITTDAHPSPSIEAMSMSPSPADASSLKRRKNRARKARLSPLGKEHELLVDSDSNNSILDEAMTGKIFPVSAIHIAQTINVAQVLSTLFDKDDIKKQMFNKNSLVVQLPLENGIPRFVAVFRFGSVVTFNVPPNQVEALVTAIKRHATAPILSGSERKESFGILVYPQYLLEQDPEALVTGDYCVVSELDMNAVAVIGNIMAQTVALDTYNALVDDLLGHFAAINSGVAKTGKFQATDKEFLFKTLAQNNSIFIDMISKIRLKDRSDTAWNMTKFEAIHYGLKEEFEIDDRFDNIEFKLNLVQQNARFFVEVLQSQKSNTLEWIIIVLIALECSIMVLDMSDLGPTAMSPFVELLNMIKSSPTGGSS